MEKINILEVKPQHLRLDSLDGLKSEIQELKNSLLAQPQKEVYLTRKEAAEQLDIDLSTLWHWKNKGILIPYGMGRRVYYKQSDIDNAMIKLN